MGDMLNSFLRMANLYNPAQMGGDMPAELPVGPMQPQLINRQGPSQSMPGQYPPQMDTPWGNIDETVEVGVEQDPTVSTLEAFKQNVMNPPKRKHMTYPKNTLAGLDAALKIAAEKSDFEKNRVFIDGDAYQQVRAFKDPNTGEVRYINKYKQPGFMEQVMKAMPASVSPAVDILNQQREDELSDWDLKNKSLGAVAKAESEMALARQRDANAIYQGARPGLEQQKIDISRLTAQERVRLSQLNTLSDQEKLQFLQDGRMSLAEYQAAEALKRVQEQQAGADRRNTADNTAAGERTAAVVAGAGARNAATIAGANQRNAATIAGANQRNTANINARGATAGATSQLPTQQKVALQNRTQQVISEHPEWAEHVSYNEQGFPVISMPDTSWGVETDPADVEMYNQIYQAIYGQPRGGAAPVQAPPAPPAPSATPPTNTPTAKPPAQTQQDPMKVPIPPPKIPGVQPIVQYSASAKKHRISYDGGKTWQPYNPYGKK